MEKKYCTAIVLAAGQGKRMGSDARKQYMKLKGKPMVYYSLRAFQESAIVDEVILVVGEGQETYARRELIEKYGFTKVSAVVVGGKERYNSVWKGLEALKDKEKGYIFIQDSARPLISEEILRRGYETVSLHRACAAGMVCKDTIKLVNGDAFTVRTPERKFVWMVQTPQIFETALVVEAYSRLMQEKDIQVTDDTMVVEQMMKMPVKLFEGSYENIKVTTPEDFKIAEAFLGI